MKPFLTSLFLLPLLVGCAGGPVVFHEEIGDQPPDGSYQNPDSGEEAVAESETLVYRSIAGANQDYRSEKFQVYGSVRFMQGSGISGDRYRIVGSDLSEKHRNEKQ
jgi:hypothetical protein